MIASSSKTAIRTLAPLRSPRSSTTPSRIPLRSLGGISSPRPFAAPTRISPGRSLTRSTPHRTFFSLPDLSKLVGADSKSAAADGVEVDGEEQRFHARKILPYTAAQLYTLVSDIPSYSSFIPFCTSSTVLGASSSPPRPGAVPGKQPGSTPWLDKADKPFDVDAELRVGFGGFEEKYTSRVVGRPYDSVTATASSNSTPLFRSLVSTWSFSPASPLSPHVSASPPPDPDGGEVRLPNDPSPADPSNGPTLLTIDLAFTFANPLHRIASQAVLPMVADKMVEAFEKRCLEVYGRGAQ